jgi:putative SOS response-associated peptidase YedK
MPVILAQKDEKRWLRSALDADEINDILKPYEGDDITAYPVSKLITARGKNKNTPEVMKKFDYPELKKLQLRLF